MEGRYADCSILASRYLALGDEYGDRNAMQSIADQSVMRSFGLGLETCEFRIKGVIETFPAMIGWRRTCKDAPCIG
jgi:hypothetical protein